MKFAGSVADTDIRAAAAERSAAARAAPSALYLLALIGGTVLAVLPVALARHLPLLDGPAHIARLAVLRHVLLEGGESAFYQVTSFLLPNVAFDLIGLGLLKLPFLAAMGPEAVGRIFFAACQLLTLWGVVALNRVAIGRWSMTALAAVLLTYSLISTLGFLSYLFGVALVPWALAGRLGAERAAPGWRFLFGTVAGLVLLFCHVAAFGIYAVMMCGVGLATLIRARRLSLRAVLPVLETLPALALLKLMPGGGIEALHYESPLILGKVVSLAKSLTCGSIVGDLACILGLVALVAAMAWGCRTRMRLDLLPGLLGIAALFVLLPLDMPPAGYIDIRLPVMVGLLGLGSIDLRVRRRPAALALAALIGLTMVVRQGAIAALWRSDDAVLEAAAETLSRLPAGAIVLQSECLPSGNTVAGMYRGRQPPLSHLAAAAGLDDTRFIGSSWAIPGQQPISVRPEYRPYYDLANTIGGECLADGPDAGQALVARVRSVAEARHPAGAIFMLLLRQQPSVTLPSPAAVVASYPGYYSLYRLW